eukprot:Skav231196  [mRNA]  locus=scaffold2432:33467:34867:- [translate_table: standard]
MCPNHAVFQKEEEGILQLDKTVPLVYHADEGRGRKHAAHFVCSFYSLIGFGLRKRKTVDWTKMECNFSGHSFTNRFLFGTMRKRDYQDEGGAWDLFMEAMAEEARFMWETGVSDNDGGHYWGVVISIVGDWPWLHKSGQFTRSFNNVQKRAVIRNPPGGLCHLCCAGKPTVQWEQLETRRPGWISTLFTETPFSEEPCFVQHILHEHGKSPAIWSFDWFHTMHLGVLKLFTSSVLALLSCEEPHGSVDDRFAALSADYKRWCGLNHRRAHTSKITKELLSWEKTTTFPLGSWHKGSLSTVLMEYIENKFQCNSFDHEPLLCLAKEACFAIQKCARHLYASGLWLSPSDCRLVSELGFQFLRRYAQLATLSQTSGRCLFMFQPKIHCLQHFMVELNQAHHKNISYLNPLAKSCQVSEDFIGRPSRLARRVTAQRPVLHRIMDRYMQSTYAHFIKAKFLVRPLGNPDG